MRFMVVSIGKGGGGGRCGGDVGVRISESSLRYPPVGISDLRNFKGITAGTYAGFFFQTVTLPFFLNRNKKNGSKLIIIMIFWIMLTELPRKVRGGSLTSNLHIPLRIRQLTQTPLYLLLFYFSLNSSNTRSSIELEEFNLISKYFLESGLSGIWRLNLNPAGSLRMSSQNSSELRNQETKGIVFFPISKIAWLCKIFYRTLLMFP